MGYRLKQALKTICGGNQWSYAVFWKIGCQNPKLLIWEDCYYEVMSCSVPPGNSKSGSQGLTLKQLQNCWLSHEAYAQQITHTGEGVHLLVNKMMMANQVHLVGEGLVGRTAFTGNHEWIVSGCFNEMLHPPEVVNEVNLQFSAGMQTVAVIPVIPHGVIQLGSPLATMENVGFIQDVKTLILQQEFGSPFHQMNSVSMDPYGNVKPFSSNVGFDGDTHVDFFQDSMLVNQASYSLSSKIHDNLKPTTSTLAMHNQSTSISYGSQCQPSTIANANSSQALKGKVANKVNQAEVIPLAPDVFLKQQTSSYDPHSGLSHGQAVASACCDELRQKNVVVDLGSQYSTGQKSVASSSTVQSQIHANEYQFSDCWTSAGSGVQIAKPSNRIVDDFSSLVDQNQPVSGGVFSACLYPVGVPDKYIQKDLYEGLNIAVSKQTDQMPSVDIIPGFNKLCYGSDDASCMTSLSGIQPSAGEDLFDALGINFKSKILEGYICKSSKGGLDMANQMKEKSQDLASFPYTDCNSMSESVMLSASGSDHLLDAVVTGVQAAAEKQSSSENLSRRTTLTRGSISSVPNSYPMFGLSTSHQRHELLGHSMPSMGSVDIGAASTRRVFGKNVVENCAQTSSYSGSQVSSWVDQGPTVKLENTVATANSKKFNVIGKPTRRKLKPGENSKPRPKDRQMIQDRLTELREIIPNGAKCSIDALLERTIKHMLFLQSVNKHADKLKQTVKSKIIDEDGALLLKGNFDGGATWAYEVGSQASMCPIIVEDLHPPSQFLVEMLCEERGFFLEIADVIRGMGLTILKGVIDKRNDKIWAHFAVEANRDITRMEIFLSLVHLLDHTMKGSNVPTNEGFNDYSTFIHPTFDPATSAPGN